MDFFLAVADERHFTRAAARCHISQSALSASIQALERELGCPLFIRSTRQVELTEAGRAFAAEAQRILDAAERARTAVDEVQTLLRGALAVGGIPTPGALDQTAILADFRHQHPAVDLRYVRENSPSLIDEVDRGTLDLVCVARPSRLPSRLAFTDLITEPIVFICRPDHPLADRASVDLETLAGENFVGPPLRSPGSEVLDRIFADTPAERPVPFEVKDPDTMLGFVEHGLGVTLLHQTLAESWPTLRGIPLSDPAVTWTLAAVTRELEEISPATRAFLDLLTARTRKRTPDKGAVRRSVRSLEGL